MRLVRFLIITVVAMFLSVGVRPASAAMFDLGVLSVGDSGVLSGSDSFGSIVNTVVTGYLPPSSMVVFKYDFSGDLMTGGLVSSGSYSYHVSPGAPSGDYYYGTVGAVADGSGGSSSSAFGYVNGAPSEPLAFASAQLSNGDDAGGLVIENYSAGLLNFTNMFFGNILGNKAYTISYNVSAVPLPAALPMFGLALVALGGFFRRMFAAA